MTSANEPLRLFLVAGEHSGDQLGGRLLRALHDMSPRPLAVSGVGGEAMASVGCRSLFPLSDIAVMGPIAIAKRLRTIMRRVHQAVDAVVEMEPDALVILDSPEFTHAVAKRVRRHLPNLPVIDYVSPSVWAWRSGRAARMRRYVDHILAILPFEPAVHERLGGPACTYIGHPLIERLDWIKSLDTGKLRESLGFTGSHRVVAVLPGSRTNEIHRMMPVYGETIQRLIGISGPLDVVLPVAHGHEELIEKLLSGWPIVPHMVHGEEDKFTAFRMADAALATSGTVTLELALARTPMVVAYRTERIVSMFRWMLRAHSIVLPNLVLGENAFPEFIQDDCTARSLAGALAPLLDENSAERSRQMKALSAIEERMALPSGTPSGKAAEIVLKLARKG